MDCTSMSRATALPCTTVARLVADYTITQRGVIVPETLGQDDELFAKIMLGLHEKGIIIDAKTALSV
jgi:saccharopine dehydrogenase-like NADP-dependent oxidoreductase